MKATNNPHLKIMHTNLAIYIQKKVTQYIKQIKRPIKLLDIGGGKGWGAPLYKSTNIDYYALDIKCSDRTHPNITCIQGDITNKELKIDTMFDIIFTKDTFEHILNPWDATLNILKLLNNNGLFIFLAPFSWRYHPSPYDTFRYTHTGAQYLFERFGKMRKVEAGYQCEGNITGFWKNKKDTTLDANAFPKSTRVIYWTKRRYACI